MKRTTTSTATFLTTLLVMASAVLLDASNPAGSEEVLIHFATDPDLKARTTSPASPEARLEPVGEIIDNGLASLATASASRART